MMKSASMLVFLVLLSSNCFGQHKYIPFPDSTANWIISQFFSPDQRWSRFGISMYGETTINGKQYHILSNHSEFGAIRQDTTTKKVYFWKKADSTEYLLYDFSLKLGDTIKGFVYQGPSVGIVDKIDSIFLNGKYHYRYYFRSTWGHYYQAGVIEGIGNEKGIFSPMDDSELSNYLICMDKNGKKYYPEGTGMCSFYASVNPVLNDNKGIVLYPNPVKAHIFIKSPFPIRAVSIHNIDGKLLGTYEFEESFTAKLNLETLTSGLYNISVETKNGVIYRRIIVK